MCDIIGLIIIQNSLILTFRLLTLLDIFKMRNKQYKKRKYIMKSNIHILLDGDF